ncbi:hypothetical protein C7437_101727 [Psychrobacillus insolitus]|uniref:Polyketide cyclase/dehydrase/lipid transport protein n=1 Tax=Psychrobacillus insolitus TaxID=1461 RepID=A0A2W7MM79_9BACI|nr:SRPBCC family protein [Psychrobacillus insolitus]PZX07608.1 hypothetical protein C7437_101727 [Psychrobacillus insolitus]
MKKWKKEIMIQAPIEFAWNFFYGDLEKKKMIFPKVMDEEIIKQTENRTGSIIKQTYQNGNSTEQYDLTIKKYINEVNSKVLAESFILNNRFKMTTEYELVSLTDNSTKFIYTSINKPKNPLLGIFQLFGSDEVILNFMERTKEAIESEYEKEVK